MQINTWLRISSEFLLNSQWPQRDTQGPGGNLIHEKTVYVYKK
jgi:hypothetical protein